MWSEKHRPASLDDIIGNGGAKSKLIAWISKWKPGARALLLVGPPGTGKTTSVHLLADSFHLNLVELNASDARTKEKLSRRLEEVLSSASLFDERSLVFLDEVDGLSGRKDHGAIEFIKEAVRGSHNPVAMAANDPDSDQVRKLSSVATVVRYEPATPAEVEECLLRVAKSEGRNVEREQLASIASSSGGDLRYAINALQSGESPRKDRELAAGQAMEAFFQAREPREALAALRAYPGQPRDKVRDVFNSVVRTRLEPEKMARVARVMSDIDLLMGRMMAGKDWRLLRYLDQMLVSDLKAALDGDGVKYTADSVPWPLQLRIWNDSKKVKEISSLVGRRTGTGQRSSAVRDFPYLAILASQPTFASALVDTLGLDEPYLTFLSKEAERMKGGHRRVARA